MLAAYTSEWPYFSHDPRCKGIAAAMAVAVVRSMRKPWCARIKCTAAGIRYKFLDGHIDYSQSNSTGSRGVRITFYVRSGAVYAARRYVNPRHAENDYFRIDAKTGELVHMTKEEAYRWAEENTESE